jgi:3-(3-hydroxy-phenyl)propionate hydroxylase
MQIGQHVIIVGAGPVGLVTANLLVDAGVAVSLVETCADLPRDLRASTFHPPTLDMLERFGVVAPMIEQGLICPTWQFRDRTEGVVATFELARLSPDTNHPYRLQCEQWRLGELLYARLENNPLATIRLGQKAIGARQKADGVELDVRLPDGRSMTISGTFLVGADGIGSIVRRAIGALFDGITIPELFLSLSTTWDFREAMPDPSNISYLSDPLEWYVLIRTARVWRALFPVDASLDDRDVTSPVRRERLLQGAVRRIQPPTPQGCAGRRSTDSAAQPSDPERARSQSTPILL